MKNLENNETENNVYFKVKVGEDPRDNFSYNEYSEKAPSFKIKKGKDPTDNFSNDNYSENNVCFQIVTENNHC